MKFAGNFRQFVTVNPGQTTAIAYALVPLDSGKPAVFKKVKGDPRLFFVANAEIQGLSGMVSGVAAAAFLDVWPTTAAPATLTADGALPVDFNTEFSPNFGSVTQGAIAWKYDVFNPANGAITAETVQTPAATTNPVLTANSGGTVSFWQKPAVKVIGWGLLGLGAVVGVYFLLTGGKRKPSRMGRVNDYK